MSFDWSHYFYLAEHLAGKQPQAAPCEESKLRAAISRTYYAAFCKARDFLVKIEKDKTVPRDGTVHSYVQTVFARSSDPLRQRLAADLNRLKISRIKSDYYDNSFNGIHNLQKETEVGLQQGKRILEILNTLFQQGHAGSSSSSPQPCP